jgi:hypothetical protein
MIPPTASLMTTIIYPDPAVHLRMYGRDERIRDYLATLSNACAQPEHRSDEQGEIPSLFNNCQFEADSRLK